MKKTQVALAALALMASTAALADGVKLYGTADVSFLNGANGTHMFGAGNNAGSILGITGGEDLGGGLKAGFTLEGGVSYGTGEVVNGGPDGAGYSGIFNRLSNISLGNDMVTVTLGGQISTFVAASLTGLAGTAGNGAFVPALSRMSGTLGGASTGAASVNAGTGPTAGAFFYSDLATINVNLNGISVTAQTKVGSNNSATGDAVGKYSAYSATTSTMGVNLAVAGFSMSNADGEKGSGYTIGGNTTVAGITLRGAYGRGNSTLVDGRGHSFGFDYSLSDALAIGYTYAKGSWDTVGPAGSNGSQNSIGAKYSLSPRTFAYATYSSFSDEGVNASAGGTGKHISIVGVAHSF